MHPIKATKYGLLLLNVIVCLSGLVMLITGSVVQGEINANKMSRTIGGYSTSAGSVICIIFGIAVLILGAFGFYSTLKDRYAFLYAYAIIMFVAFLVQFITGVVALAVKGSSSFDSYVSKVLQPELSYNSTAPDERDFYQIRFKCCGWNGPSDYFDPINGTFEAPMSCCLETIPNCDPTKIMELNRESCNYKLMDLARGLIGGVGGVLLAFGIINFFSIGLSVFMARQISKGYQYS